MPITDRQREQRRRHIGASDVPVLLGLSSYRTPYELWLDKTGQLMPNTETSEAAEIGNAMEASVLRWGAEQLGVSIRRNVRRVRGCMAANLDAMVIGRPWALEAKTSGIMHPAAARDQWGPEGTDEVPPHVAAQALAQMWVADLEMVAIPALIGGRGLVLYRIERDERTAPLCENIAERCAAWWDRHIIGGEPPPATPPPSMEVLARVVRQPGSVADIDPAIVAEYHAALAESNVAKRRLEAAKAALVVSLGNAEVGRAGQWAISYAERNRAGYTVAAKMYRQLEVKPVKEATQ